MQLQCLPADHQHLHCSLCGHPAPHLHRAYRLRSTTSLHFYKLFCTHCIALVQHKRLERRLWRQSCKRRPRRVMSEDRRIAVCKTSVSQIYEMLRSSPQQWRSFLVLARSVMAHLDTTTFMQQADRTAEQTWLITGLQRLAYCDADNGGIQDIAAWCSRQWLVIFQRDPSNVAALRGTGQAWLSRAQPTLARIHRQDGSGSSSGGSSRSIPSLSSEQEAALTAQQNEEQERRAGTSDYVEARGFLQPATEYLERAVTAATAQQSLSGDLLATAAEAYMSLGNTSSPRVNEQYFRRAIQLLRAASAAPGYTLSRYLQQYLDDYGRLLD